MNKKLYLIVYLFMLIVITSCGGAEAAVVQFHFRAAARSITTAAAIAAGVQATRLAAASAEIPLLLMTIFLLARWQPSVLY